MSPAPFYGGNRAQNGQKPSSLGSLGVPHLEENQGELLPSKNPCKLEIMAGSHQDWDGEQESGEPQASLPSTSKHPSSVSVTPHTPVSSPCHLLSGPTVA